MQKRLMSILVRVAWILLLAVICCGAPQADAASSGLPGVIEGRASDPSADQTAEKGSETNLRNRILPRISLLTPNPRDRDQERTIISREPFDLRLAEALPNEVSAKWADLQSRTCRSVAIDPKGGMFPIIGDRRITRLDCGRGGLRPAHR